MHCHGYSIKYGATALFHLETETSRLGLDLKTVWLGLVKQIQIQQNNNIVC